MSFARILPWVGWFLAALFLILYLIASGIIDRIWPPKPTENWGNFSLGPNVTLLADRDVRLIEAFTYTDPRGRVWIAEKDGISNGASIPKAFWSITGGPLEGKFRNAAVVHDAACVRKTEKDEDVHTMFYEACRCGGVPELQAKLLYSAVTLFGPRWIPVQVEVTTVKVREPDGSERTETRINKTRAAVREIRTPPATEQTAKKLDRYIREKMPTLEQISALTPEDVEKLPE